MRPLPLLTLALLALPALSPGAQTPAENVVGRVVAAKRQVEGTPPGGPARPLLPGNDVIEQMLVATGERSATRIAVGLEVRDKGAVYLGPETRLAFEKWLVDLAGGTFRELDLRLQVGSVLAAILPHPGGTHTVWIRTPRLDLRLRGTTVWVQVAPDGTTTVAVLEGAVEVTEREEPGALPPPRPAILLPPGRQLILPPGRDGGRPPWRIGPLTPFIPSESDPEAPSVGRIPDDFNPFYPPICGLRPDLPRIGRCR